MSHRIVITDPVRLRAAIEFADKQGCLDQFGRNLCQLLRVLTGGMVKSYGENGNVVPTDGSELAEIGYDHAPLSFSFAIWHNAETPAFRADKSQLSLAGGFIYSGPGVPNDGSAPALTVSLEDVMGLPRPTHVWRCHT